MKGMPYTAFDEWTPDQVIWNNKALINAKNVVPSTVGYLPLKSYVALSSAFDTARVRGSKTFRSSDSTLTTIAGSKTKLKKYNAATLGWTDISDAAYATNPEFGFWSFCQYGTLAVMTNLANPIKKYDISTAPATVSSLLGTPPQAMHVMTVKDNLVAANLSGLPARCQWADTFQPEAWSSGVADYQDFPDGGRIMSVMGGEVGYLFQERSIRAMQFTPGAPTVFQFDPVDQDRGSAAYQGLLAVGSQGFYLAHDGFFKFNAGQSIPVGSQKIDDWFRSNALSAYIARTVAGIDPKKKLIFWAFISTENTDATADVAFCDKLLILHWPTGRFAWAAIRVSSFVDIAQLGITLDTMGNIDTLPLPMDSLAYNSDSISSQLGIFTDDFTLGFLSGLNMQATFEFERLEFFPPMRQYVRGFWPIIDGPGIQVAVAPRETIASAESFGSFQTQGSGGFIPADSSARMHDVKVNVPASTVWTHARGMFVDVIPDGEL